MKVTPLDAWSREKMAGMSIADWQLIKLRETLILARKSKFYRERLPEILPESLSSLAGLPLMDAEDVIRSGTELLCAPASEILRIVTLFTSGTNNKPKRICFTEADIELTIDYFAHGLPTIVEPSGSVAVMMPCCTPDGVGDLICRGLERISVRTIRWGLMESFQNTAQMLRDELITAIVGTPIQVLALMRYLRLKKISTKLTAVLLSADNIPTVTVQELKAQKLRVYKHFGMTETGFGCAIDCDFHAGQHIRESDLLIEIVDRETKEPVPDGQWGEIVFTTLARQGMPLIRYRTGDYSRIIPGICPCGSTLRRLDDVRGRLDGGVLLAGGMLTMTDLDEVLLALPPVMDFFLEATENTLNLRLSTFSMMPSLEEARVMSALLKIPAISRTKNLDIRIEITAHEDYMPLYQNKRTLVIK